MARRAGAALRSAAAVTLLYSWIAPAAQSQITATADAVIAPVEVTLIVLPDAEGIESGLTGTHTIGMRPAPRSKAGQTPIDVGCVPCFNVLLSFAFSNGRLYAMHWQTDARRDRYRAMVEGRETPIEPMNGLRGRDWLDAFGGINKVPGCARDLVKGKDLDAVVRQGICIAE